MSNPFEWRGKPSIFVTDKRFTWNAPRPIKPTPITSNMSIATPQAIKTKPAKGRFGTV